ncbi:OmpH family outer membrane protein [bacterium]|nr:OmpH family outer membrane protein [bacterium]
MKKKISFLFVCLMAFALGYSINNIAISDTAPKIAVVDLQKILTSSSKVQQLKADQEKKVAEIQNTLQKAQSEIANEKDPKKVAELEEKYRDQINNQKIALDEEYNKKLTQIDTEVRATVTEKAKSLNYNLVLPKNIVFYGGEDITDVIAKEIK